MADHAFWLGSLGDVYSEPFIMKGIFVAGATTAIEAGEILELSTTWIPLDADQSMAGVIAFANEDIDSGDLAGYYEIVVPRPGDIFKVPINTASAIALGTPLFWTSDKTVTVTTGNNELGKSVRVDHYPRFQNHLSKGVIGDNGTTVKTPGDSYVHMTITAAASYWAALQG